MRLPLLLLWLASMPAPASDRVGELVRGLDADDFQSRERASAHLAEAFDSSPDEVLEALFSRGVQGSPEASARTAGVLRLIYRRVALGEGQPVTGWHVERLLEFGGDGLPAFLPIVLSVDEGSPAAAAGIDKGDAILAVGGAEVPPEGAMEFLRRAIAKAGPGAELKLTVEHHPKDPLGNSRRVKGGQGRREVTVTLGDRAAEAAAGFNEAHFEFWRLGVAARYSGSP